MKKSTQLLLLLFCLIMTAQTAACGKQANENSEIIDASLETEQSETTVTETQDPASTLDIPVIEWGRQFRVLGVRDNTYPELWNTFEIDAEKENGEVVNDTVFRRNTIIEDRYKVEIVELYDESIGFDRMADFLKKAILTQEDLYDLAFVAMNQCGAMARSGYFYDFNKVEYIDFTKNWWNQTVLDVLEYDEKLYFVSSDFSLRDKSRSGFLTYNREMVKNYNLENPVELVRNGTWTLDKMNEMMDAVSFDLNGNNIIDEEDSFGLGFGNVNSTTWLITGAENFTVTKDAEGHIQLNVASEKVLSTIDKILLMTTDPAKTMMVGHWKGKSDGGDPNTLAHRTFYKGNMLFVGSFTDTLTSYSKNCEFEYGILPNPKFDEKQEHYYSYADPNSLLMSIPITCSDPDFTGFMLEALSQASTETTKKAYLETVCRYKYLVDLESAEMLDIALSNVYYDPVVIFNISRIGNIWTEVISRNSNTLASRYESVKDKAEADIVKLSEDFASLD